MSVVKSTEIFDKMGPILEKSGADIVKKIQAVYLFEIRATKESQPVFFTIDLKNGNGKIAIEKHVCLTSDSRQDHQW